MSHDTFSLPTGDDCLLMVHRWVPDQPTAMVMLAHGMAEHAGRYERLALALNRAGYGLYAHDQRGHGLTAAPADRGLFALQDGWGKVVGDLSEVRHVILQQYPGIPVVILGHSMGSYIAQAWLLDHSQEVCGAVFSGSNFEPPSVYRSARLIVRAESWRQGPKGRSALVDWLSFGSFNKAFKPNRTAFDWLSRDPQEVDRYIADPLCGFRCTNQLWLDLLQGLQTISDPRQLKKLDPQLAVLIIGGECDPLSDGKRLYDLGNAMGQAGLKDVQTHVYPNARHEVLNELNRDEVARDLMTWLDRLFPSGPP